MNIRKGKELCHVFCVIRSSLSLCPFLFFSLTSENGLLVQTDEGDIVTDRPTGIEGLVDDYFLGDKVLRAGGTYVFLSVGHGAVWVGGGIMFAQPDCDTVETR